MAAASAGIFTGQGRNSALNKRRYHGVGRAAAITRSTKPAGVLAGSTACNSATVERSRSSSRRHSAHVARCASTVRRSLASSASSISVEKSSRTS